MHIAVCDNEENVRFYIRKLIEKQGIFCRITEFASGKSLLEYMEAGDGQKIDLLFLDISMEDMDGITAARIIRSRTEERQEAIWGSLPLLIFVTGYAEYMQEAFAVHAFQYLMKPVQEKAFNRVFAQAVQEWNLLKPQRQVRELILRNGSTRRRIPADEIYYAECLNRKIVLHLMHEKAEYYAKISDLEKELGGLFFRIHRGYLIHMKYIERYDRRQVWMKNGDCLLISKYKYPDFVKAYLNYLSGESL